MSSFVVLEDMPHSFIMIYAVGRLLSLSQLCVSLFFYRHLYNNLEFYPTPVSFLFLTSRHVITLLINPTKQTVLDPLSHPGGQTGFPHPSQRKVRPSRWPASASQYENAGEAVPGQ